MFISAIQCKLISSGKAKIKIECVQSKNENANIEKCIEFPYIQIYEQDKGNLAQLHRLASSNI
jgi:hypothetical protein